MDRKFIATIGSAFLFLVVLGGCGTVHKLKPSVIVVGPILGLPSRIAILRSKVQDPTFRHDALYESAYGRLELQTGELLRQSKNIIVERRDLRSIRDEQWWQYQPEASEKVAAPVGELLGAELLFIYRITVPSYRERLFNHGSGPQIMVAVKVLRVETGEVVWSHISAVQMHPQQFYLSNEYTQALQEGLDQVVDAMLTAVRDAIAISNPQK